MSLRQCAARASPAGTPNATWLGMQTIDRQALRPLMARQPRLDLVEVLRECVYDYAGGKDDWREAGLKLRRAS